MKPASPIGLANLGPLAQLKAGRLPERVLRLLVGLWLYGLAIALMIEGAVGASPWDVFHLGVSRHLPLSFGTVMILAAVAVLLAWIPLRQMPGLGTLANTLLLGPFADLNLAWLATPEGLRLRCAYLLDLPAQAPWQLNLTTIVEEANGRKSYWALAHPPGKADFHHDDGFVLSLPAVA